MSSMGERMCFEQKREQNFIAALAAEADFLSIGTNDFIQ